MNESNDHPEFTDNLEHFEIGYYDDVVANECATVTSDLTSALALDLATQVCAQTNMGHQVVISVRGDRAEILALRLDGSTAGLPDHPVESFQHALHAGWLEQKSRYWQVTSLGRTHINLVRGQIGFPPLP